MNINKLTHQLIRGLLPESNDGLNEVGEASSKSYSFTKEEDNLEIEDNKILGTSTYNFLTDNDIFYDVKFSYYTTEKGENGVSIDFTVDEDYEMTNKGELFKVMTTIVNIIKQELTQPAVYDILDFITYLPAKNKSKVGAAGGDIQRDKLYKAFIKKQIPNVVEKPGPGGLTYFYIKESYEGKRTDKGAPGTLKAKITKLYGGDVTIEKARKLKNRKNATAHDKRQANWFINFHSKNESLNEVGEGSAEPYQWKETKQGNDYVYTQFTTDAGTEYNVNLEVIDYKDLPAMDVEFSAKPTGAEGSSFEVVVNKGELFRVMSTVGNIVKHYAKDKFKDVKAITYSATKKTSEEEFDTQRDKLYKTFIAKTIPGVRFEQDGEIVAGILPGVEMVTEAKQVGTLYHFTSAEGLKGILESNHINASEETYLGHELYFVSFTRNKNFHKKRYKWGVSTEYRITIDGNKLSNKYRIKPFAYIPGWDYTDSWEYEWLEDEPESAKRDFFNATGTYDEQEERISFKGPEGGISNIKDYILAIDKVEELEESTAQASSQSQVNFRELEATLDSIFDDLDIDVVFTKHFKERVIERGLTKEDILDLMAKIHDRYGEEVADLPKGNERVFTHLTKLVDIASAAGGYGDDGLKDLLLTTAFKRKNRYEPGLKTSRTSPRLTVSETKDVRLLVRKTNKIQAEDTGKAAPYGSGYKRLAKEYNETLPEESMEDLLTPYIVDLTKYMYSKGLTIDPAPGIEFVEDDDNAKNPLGKTAYYDPNNQLIVVYTTARHPKDILRSFAHEMIHHCQNMEGRLGNVTTQNVNEDDYLKELEREAYETGNLCFREWENSRKEKRNYNL